MAKVEELRSADLAKLKPKDQVKHLLERNRTNIEAMLPKHVTPERLMKVAQVAATTTPGLLECYVPTLINGIIVCAQLGLEPNTVLGHAYLIPFNNRQKGRKDAQLIIGYKGLIDLARRSGQIESIAAHAVRANDKFEFEYGLDEKLRHVPAGDASEITHFYAIAKFKDGGHAFEVMTKGQVDAIRAMSKTGGSSSSPWANHYEEMGRKTVIRRLSKYLPMSIELASAVALDSQASRGEQDLEGAFIDGEFSVLDSAADDPAPPAQDEAKATAETKGEAKPGKRKPKPAEPEEPAAPDFTEEDDTDAELELD